MEPNTVTGQQNKNRANDYDDQTIDLVELARVIWGHIWYVVIGFVIGAALLFSVTKFLITPLYKAESIIYVFSKTTSITQLADINLGSTLTEEFKIIGGTRDVVESVINELHLDTTYEELSKRISIVNPSNSHLLRISVTDEDPIRSANISNVLSEHLRERIADIMSTDKPSVVQRAVVPVKKSSLNTTRNTEIGALAGALLVVAWVVIRYMLDDTIKTDEDVTKYLQLDTLAAFPYIKAQDESSKDKKTKSGARGGRR